MWKDFLRLTPQPSRPSLTLPLGGRKCTSEQRSLEKKLARVYSSALHAVQLAPPPGAAGAVDTRPPAQGLPAPPW